MEANISAEMEMIAPERGKNSGAIDFCGDCRRPMLSTVFATKPEYRRPLCGAYQEDLLQYKFLRRGAHCASEKCLWPITCHAHKPNGKKVFLSVFVYKRILTALMFLNCVIDNV